MNPEEIKAQNILKGKQAIQSIANSANTVNKVAQTAQAIQRTPIPQPSFTDAIGSFAQAVIKPFQTVSETATRIGQGLGSDVRAGLEGKPSAVLAAPKAISEYTSRVGQKIGTSVREGRPGDILTSAGSEIMGGLRTFGAGVGTATGKASDAIANTIRLSLKENKTADDYKNIAFEGLNALGATLDAPNAIFIKPVWNSIKVSIAEEMGNKIDNKQDIISGAAELSLPDLLKIDPNSPDYQAYRFLDFAPQLINLPGSQTGTGVKALKAGVPGKTFASQFKNAARQFEKLTGAKIPANFAQNVRKAIENIPIGKGGRTKNAYVQEMVKKQKQAREIGTPTILQRLKNVANEVDVKLQDFTTPINQAVNRAIKEGKKILPSENPIYQIDRVLRANSLASQYIKDNGLASIIQKAENLDEFNQYLIAKSTQELLKRRPKVKTGRDALADAKLIEELAPKYDALANQVFEYNNNLLNQIRASGLISGDLYNTLVKSRENYVPLQRIFSEIEDITQGVASKQVASIGKQSVIKKLEGSEREIVNPVESMLTNTYRAVSQIERNIAARQLANLVDRKIIPGRVLSKGEKFNSNEVISFLKNGEKVNVFVGKDIARAAKNLNKENTNFLIGLLAFPTRLLQVGAVGLNTTFILSNLIRDQLTAAVVAGKPFKNTILNPINFGKALFEIYGDAKVYDDFLRAGAGYTSLDLTRDVAKTVKQLRAEATPWSKAGYNVTSPVRLLNAVEDFVGRAETVTRLQVFKNARDDFRKQGYSAEDAETLAADLARNVTANFARRGEWGTVLNAVIPFFNATVQGTRTLRNAFVKNPGKTTALFATTVGIPVATTTLWNLTDPERKKVYDTIPEFEKERNLIILPPVITYDDRGYPFFIRIPKAQGFSNLADPIRKLLENSYESAPDAVMNVANNLLAATTGYQIPTDEQSRRQMTSQFTPQILKPFIEATTGVNLFTGQRIVPMGLEKLPPEEQVKENTSYTARQIGKAINVSPLLVENTVRTSGAEVGSQLLNLSDKVLAPAGTPQEQVGGRDPVTGLVEVFYRARGGADVEQIYKDIEKIDQEKGLLNLKVKDAILKNDIETLQKLAPLITSQQFKALENSVSEKEIAKTLGPVDKSLFKLSTGQLESLKEARPDLFEKITDIEEFRKQFSERSRINTSGFRFKSGGLKLPKIKSTLAKRPKVKKAPKIKAVKMPKIKSRKPIKIKGLKAKKTKRKNV